MSTEPPDSPAASSPAPAARVPAAHAARAAEGPTPAELEDGGRAEALVAASLGVGRYTRHVLLCTGPTCASAPVATAAWSYLKARLRQLEQEGKLPAQDVYRTKVGCLRVCRGGPICVVYPDGTWYREATADNLPRILDEHLVHGRVVADLAFASNPLGGPGA